MPVSLHVLAVLSPALMVLPLPGALLSAHLWGDGGWRGAMQGSPWVCGKQGLGGQVGLHWAPPPSLPAGPPVSSALPRPSRMLCNVSRQKARVPTCVAGLVPALQFGCG